MAPHSATVALLDADLGVTPLTAQKIADYRSIAIEANLEAQAILARENEQDRDVIRIYQNRIRARDGRLEALRREASDCEAGVVRRTRGVA